MPFSFGERSRTNLIGVHPNLVMVAMHALELTKVDFGVLDGIRTLAEQRHFVDIGASQTMNSNHLPKADGLGHAIDIAPYVNGKILINSTPGYYRIAETFRLAAIRLHVRIKWGGNWFVVLNDTIATPEQLVAEYIKQHPGPDFIDMPHYQLA